MCYLVKWHLRWPLLLLLLDFEVESQIMKIEAEEDVKEAGWGRKYYG